MSILLALPLEILNVRSVAAASAGKRRKLLQADEFKLQRFFIKLVRSRYKFYLALLIVIMYCYSVMALVIITKWLI